MNHAGLELYRWHAVSYELALRQAAYEATFHAHQVPLSDPASHPEHLKLLEDWLMSYANDPK